MKKGIILGLVTSAMTSISFAQGSEVEYYYDDAGNRIQRVSIVVGGGNRMANDSILSLKDNYSFKIYPNVTEGVIKIQAEKKFLELTNREIEVYSIEGKFMKRIDFDRIEEIVDLSSYEDGVYIIYVSAAEGYKADWRVIKK